MSGMENYSQIALGENDNSCFIVMPFDGMFQTQYERVIKPAVEAAGLKCIRGDEIYSKPNIMSDIWAAIRSARVIVAELTGRNANVFYEIGLAHAIGKPVILLTRNENDVPFDLRALRYRFYDPNDPFWGENLSASLTEMLLQVIAEPSLSTHLEGIAVHSVQNNKTETEIEIPQRKVVAHDVSGLWHGEWSISDGPSGFARTLTSGQLFLAQNNRQLSGSLTVSFTDRVGGTAVVQQQISGDIDGDKISLSGVSYTYINRGASESYALDSFQLVLKDDLNSMEGELINTSYDGKKANGVAKFVRESQ